jgi:hypothetical protein
MVKIKIGCAVCGQEYKGPLYRVKYPATKQVGLKTKTKTVKTDIYYCKEHYIQFQKQLQRRINENFRCKN